MKLSNYGFLALGALVLAATGCSTMNTVENVPVQGQRNIIADRRVITDPDLARSVAIIAVNTTPGAGGLLRAQVEVANHMQSVQRFLYKFEWFDANGMQVNNIISANLTEQLEGGESKFISSIAPTPDCKDFRLKLLSAN